MDDVVRGGPRHGEEPQRGAPRLRNRGREAGRGAARRGCTCHPVAPAPGISPCNALARSVCTVGFGGVWLSGDPAFRLPFHSSHVGSALTHTPSPGRAEGPERRASTRCSGPGQLAGLRGPRVPLRTDPKQHGAVSVTFRTTAVARHPVGRRSGDRTCVIRTCAAASGRLVRCAFSLRRVRFPRCWPGGGGAFPQSQGRVFCMPGSRVAIPVLSPQRQGNSRSRACRAASAAVRPPPGPGRLATP